MKIKEITAVIEQFAPLALQESYDNSGLIAGNSEAEVESALLCVDCTEDVMAEAVRTGAGMVISHHPVIFNGLKRLTGATQVERVVAQAIRHGIALYACHTNLDATSGGLSYCLAEMIGLRDTRLLSPSKDERTGFGVIGTLDTPVPTLEFLRDVARKLSVEVVRHSAPATQTVRTVAICSGSGASLIDTARTAGAELYLAADFKYNNFLDAARALTVADIGHFESEYCAIDLLYTVIRKKFPTFALRKSADGSNPVHYLVNN